MAWGSWDAVIESFGGLLELAQRKKRHRYTNWKVDVEEYAMHMLELVELLKAHPIIGQAIPGTRLGSLVLWHDHSPNKQLNIIYTDHKIYTIFVYLDWNEDISDEQDVTQENLIPVIIAYLEKLASSQ